MPLFIKTRLKQIAAATLFSGTLIALPMPLMAQTAQSGSLYYKLGGSSYGGQSNYPHQNQIRLQLGASVRLNYSCGKFDIGATWTNNFQQVVRDLGPRIQAAIQAYIGALPMYMFERAQPGLYKLFTEYGQKIDELVADSIQSCEQIEASYKKRSDEKLANEADAQQGKQQQNSQSNDAVASNDAIKKADAGKKAGIPWVFGAFAGGDGQPPIKPVYDLAVAAYNVILNRPTTSSATAPPANAAQSTARMVASFMQPQALADFATKVLGDQSITLCNQAVAATNCPLPTSYQIATGLGKALDEEINQVRPVLATLANNTDPNIQAPLAAIAAPGMAVNAQLLDALRTLPPDSRSLAVNRLTHEMAMQRIVDKALIARNVLITGLGLPEVTAGGAVYEQVQEKIDRLTQYIEDLMFEHRIRKEVTSDTAQTIMQAAAMQKAQSAGLPKPLRPDAKPLEDGRVAP